MDINNLSIQLEQLVGGIVALVIGFGWLRKKFSFDNLEITKSNTERDLIELLREQVSVSSKDFTDLKEKLSELEKTSKDIGRQRDEALKYNEIALKDIQRLENKIKIYEGIINRLTEALEITSEQLNNESDEN